MKAGEEYQVLGIRKGTSKDGVKSCVLYLVTPFEQNELDYFDSCEGNKVTSEYSRDLSIIPENLKINDVVTLSYRKGFQGTAVLAGVHIVKTAGK